MDLSPQCCQIRLSVQPATVTLIANTKKTAFCLFAMMTSTAHADPRRIHEVFATLDNAVNTVLALFWTPCTQPLMRKFSRTLPKCKRDDPVEDRIPAIPLTGNDTLTGRRVISRVR